MTPAVLGLPFDQSQRYRLVSDLLRQCDGSRLPFQDASFDAVCAFDTLEHVPVPLREAFVSEVRRVSRKWVILAGPYAHPRVEEAEALLQKFLEQKLGERHRYLDEHLHNGLPDRARIERQLEASGARVVAIPHGNLDRWLVLQCLAMYMDYDPALRPIARDFQRFYNESLYASDHAEPVYRHVIVAAIGAARLPKVEELLDAPVAPAGALRQSFDMLGNLVHFDRERTWWLSVRGELERVIASYSEQSDAWQKGAEHTKEQIAKAQERYEHIFAAYQSSESGRKWAVGQLESTQAALAAAKAGTGIDELRAELEQARQARALAEKELAETRGKLRGAEELLAQRELVYDEQQRELSSRWRSLVRFFTGGR
ncbi:MAG: methyltransferase domain-containing protein [Planctomycetota bacterium]|nr:methyltransferase domain-containing protein [Planctomycetota bacterium]